MNQNVKTLRIRLNTAICGNRFAYQKDDVIDWPQEEAERYIERGMATLATEALTSTKSGGDEKR
jgi:hypothetical protein